MNTFVIRQSLILILLCWATAAGWSWVWALLFAAWTFQSASAGTVFLLEPVERARTPILFWLVTATWLGLALLMALQDI